MNSQPALKGQDIVVALKLALTLRGGFTYVTAASSLGLAPSRVHASVKMLLEARLAVGDTKNGVLINRARLLPLLIYGLPFFLPPLTGGIGRGMATAFELDEIREGILDDNRERYVWPDPAGSHRGVALAPLHSCVNIAATNDATLYRSLMAIDAVRVGAIRERNIATSVLTKLFA
ncbi:MAG: hypothetical protein ABI411_19885 [Tahibacter sp.]